MSPKSPQGKRDFNLPQVKTIRRILKFSAATENSPAVAAEANRRFADRLRSPVNSRTASDVLRRLLAEDEG